jgi:integrase
MRKAKTLSNSPRNDEDSCQASENVKNISLLKFYAEYYEYISLKYSYKYLLSITTLFNHVFKYFGKNKSLQEIEYLGWDKFFLHLNNKCPGGVFVYLRTLKAALNKAVEWGMISDNNLKKIKLPKRQQIEQKFLTVDELNTILDGISNKQIRSLIKTAFYTGLRRSELINLKVKHVNLKEGFLIVGGEGLVTKSRRIREVALCDQVKNLLEDIINKKKPDDLLFGKTNRIPYTADHVSSMFKKAVRGKQLSERIHFHTCRHSYITHLANSELPLPAVQLLAGHANVSTTMRYVHVNRMELMKSVNVLNKLN